jgi:dTMP kinase
MGRLVVFTGIDGSGKSTLINRLEAEGRVPGAVYARKAFGSNAARVRRFHSNGEKEPRDWASGAFAETIAIAHCFDFLEHYDRVLAPLVALHPLVVSDRYSLCFDAYLRGTGCRFDATTLFAALPRPDLVVHIDIPIEVARQRFQQRGGPEEGEEDEVLARFQNAYELILPSAEHIVRIRNDRPFDITLAEATDVVLSHAQDWGVQGGPLAHAG